MDCPPFKDNTKKKKKKRGGGGLILSRRRLLLVHLATLSGRKFYFYRKCTTFKRY